MRLKVVVYLWFAGLLALGMGSDSPRSWAATVQGPVIQQSPKGMRIIVQLGFAYASYALPAEALPVLDQVGGILKDDWLYDKVIAIVGHANESEYIDVNWLLAKYRALAVQQYLAQRHGIAMTRIPVVSRGSVNPLDPANPWSPVNHQIEFISQ